MFVIIFNFNYENWSENQEMTQIDQLDFLTELISQWKKNIKSAKNSTKVLTP
ncbi:hypothetical protein MICAH_4220007 [Microcystis aeruginosa PCC 9809]|uniref:Uncharacterized protein n=2 Tax=Microcystis aeruginosa TaxID=1126 RepID=I4HY41_MICAE|nr:hypothetical protein MICAB_980006 [Microcystis aeruginosa PCC 9717]CCI26965.1 hypothetical protein MICAH_4220007 [Microcystis aeruginosa PCC 9809]